MVRENGRIQFRILGTAVCINPKGLFLTARHCAVVEDNSIPFKNWKLRRLSVVRAHFTPTDEIQAIEFKNDGFVAGMEEYDLGIFSGPKELIPYPYIKVADKYDLKEGQEIGCAGFPVTGLAAERFNLRPNLFSGIISRLDFKSVDKGVACHNIVVDMSLHPGNSGGPIFDKNGDLIAIVASHELRSVEDLENGVTIGKIGTNLTHCVPFYCFRNVIGEGP
jgi:S1-C subfamily serine protease